MCQNVLFTICLCLVHDVLDMLKSTIEMEIDGHFRHILLNRIALLIVLTLHHPIIIYSVHFKTI